MFHVKRLMEEEGVESPGGGASVETPEEPRDDSRLDEIAQRLDAQQSQLQQFFAGFKPQQRQTPQPDEDQRQRMREEFFNDPLTHTQRIAQATAAQMAQHREAQEWPGKVEAAKDKVRGSDSKLFDRYADEIQKYVQQYDQQHWTNPETWKQALNAAKVAHFDDIVEERRKLAERDHDGPGVPGPKGQPKPKEQELTEEQHQAAKMLRLTPEEYKKALKIHEQDQRDPEVGYDIVNSVWGEHIVFDSDHERKKAVNA